VLTGLEEELAAWRDRMTALEIEMAKIKAMVEDHERRLAVLEEPYKTQVHQARELAMELFDKLREHNTTRRSDDR